MGRGRGQNSSKGEIRIGKTMKVEPRELPMFWQKPGEMKNIPLPKETSAELIEALIEV